MADVTPDEVALVLTLGDSDPIALDNMRTEWARRIVASDLIASSWLAQRDARIRAEALREAADDVPMFEFMLVMDIASEVAPAQIAGWLRFRADRIEAQS